ncbi:response regulator [Fusibacter paucivorans]|uniref:Stage 0 sporulation protein A homolog n=1 Tax=Fusibacter paucivorans TaxID=76009 RepID=A0ABS5PJ33_9FIRM|nr:response regulator [Fusibacter paucivorans]MBS7525085.1 response regulator [Fusibacter paucivorans]
MSKILIAEDDAVSRKFLNQFMSQFGSCDLVIDGYEAVDAFLLGIQEGDPYDLICLDIMMPKLDGIQVLQTIRKLESETLEGGRSRIIMTTALGETEMVRTAFDNGCDAYASKPIDTEKFVEVLGSLGIKSMKGGKT